jgi:AcrR family transcriptional regulator
VSNRPATVVAMQNRRERILSQARILLADGDPGAFSLRKLAVAAQVSVPTIYNLIGNRDAILVELGSQLIERIERHLDELEDAHSLEMAEAVVLLATDAVAEDEEFHRAAELAMTRLPHDAVLETESSRHYARCVELQHRATRRAREQGLLRGEIDPELLARQIFQNYLQASSQWVRRQIDLAEFRKRALLGVYLYMAADAEETFRPILLEKITQQSAPSKRGRASG